jgi:membrane-associated phospholipid phosphatase
MMTAKHVFVCTVLLAGRATAQDSTSVPVWRDAAIGGAFFAAAAVVSPFDTRLAVASQHSSVQRSTFLRDGANGFDAVGVPGTFVLALGFYAGGWLAHDRGIATLGLHAGEALAASTVVTELLGGVTGRARPSVDIHHSGTFQFAEGFRSDAHASFPSEHATAGFAMASVLAAESSRRWPHASRWITPLAYTVASLVGVARVYKNEHWASDVLVGAGIGTVTGLVAVQYRGDQILLPR